METITKLVKRCIKFRPIECNNKKQVGNNLFESAAAASFGIVGSK